MTEQDIYLYHVRYRIVPQSSLTNGLLAAALIFCLAGCGPDDGAPAGQPDGGTPQTLSLLFTGNVAGYIEPCG